MQTVYSFMPWAALHGPRISSDLDFMLLKLFRTNGGLGYTFRMTQVLQELRYLSENDHRCLNLHRRQHESSSDGELVKGGTVASDLVWNFHKAGVYETFERRTKYIVLPDSFRGTILGLAGFAPTNESALYICFGNLPAMGIPFALGRVFKKVNVINFNPDYRNEKRPAELSHRPFTQITIVTCHEDIMTADSELSNKFIPELIEEIWVERDKRNVERNIPSDLIVVQPLYSEAQKTTVSLFLKIFRGFTSEDALLVSLCPTDISGKKVVEGKDFFKFQPPQSLFREYPVKAVLDKGSVETKKKVFKWPPEEYSEEDVSRGATSEELEGEGTKESLPLIVERDTCLFCRCCKRNCRCQEKLVNCKSHFRSQLNCGEAFCLFEISVFENSLLPPPVVATVTSGEQRTE